MAVITGATPGKIVIVIFLALMLVYLVTTLFVLNKHIVIPVIPTP